MKRGIEEFKEAVLEGESFSDELNKVQGLDDVLEIAKKHGYDITIEDLEKDEISDDILYSVAGGADKRDKMDVTNLNVFSNNTKVVFSNKTDEEIAKKIAKSNKRF